MSKKITYEYLEKLLHCPFCNGRGILKSTNDHLKNYPIRYSVECEFRKRRDITLSNGTCPASPSTAIIPNKKLVIKLWNTRFPFPNKETKENASHA